MRHVVIKGAAGIDILAASACVEAHDWGKIMPLGDSITGGANGLEGYRYPLFYNLRATGDTFDFVGSRSWGRPGDTVFDKDNEGHGGWKMLDLLNGKASEPSAGKLSDWLSGYRPDTIILLAGANDEITTQAVYESRYDALIGQIYTSLPAAHLVLGTSTPVDTSIDTRPGAWDKVLSLQAAAVASGQRAQDAGHNVTIVDTLTGFDPHTMLFDAVHPNAAGNEFLASRFEDGIAAAPVPEPCSLTMLAIGGVALLRRRR
jgi:acyl-CoA thioesterase-1